MSSYDVVIRGGTVATATDTFEADVGIVGETIAAIGRGLPQGKSEIDAKTISRAAPARQLSGAPRRWCASPPSTRATA